MSVCTKCGHALGVGRFCVNCGHPIGAPVDDTEWRTGTAERPAVPAGAPPDGGSTGGPVSDGPVSPPPAHTSPLDPPRYPLFADEALAPVAPEVAGLPAAGPPPSTEPEPRRAVWWPWVVAAAALLAVVAVLGVRLMLPDDDDTAPATATPTTREPKPSKSREPSKTPKPSPTKASPKPGEPEDVAGTASASVPATAPPNQDVNGNTVSYAAGNMLDGVASTCWRMPGDGAGEEIVFRLAEETEIVSVGLINGYAKTASGSGGTQLDWYAGNRRILAVSWVFDDGTVVDQDLQETRELQGIDIDPETTSTIRLRLVEVSRPGTGPSARNYTAVSEVSLFGTPSG